MNLPKELERKVKVEAGHRCAIPTCKLYPIDIHHITPKEKGGGDTFTNLIALCSNCHSRFHRYKDIDIKSMKTYKANLGLLNARYNEMERRLLGKFYKQIFLNEVDDNGIQLSSQSIKLDTNEMPISGGIRLFFDNLIIDELLEVRIGRQISGGVPTFDIYRITDKGKVFIEKWKKGQLLE